MSGVVQVGARGKLRKAAFACSVLLVALLAVPEPSRAATFTVANLNDAGAGSLRQAIIDANASVNAPGIADRIEFSVAGEIVLATPLESIQESVVIDGTTAPGYASPVVRLSGAGNDCVVVAADDVTMAALSIGDCDRGILVTGARATIAGNEIGVDATGNAAAPNIVGIELDLGAAGTVVIGNVVSGNGDGITVSASGTEITGNLIGLGRDGTTDVGNSDFGVDFLVESAGGQVGGTAPGARNVISANGGSDNGGGIRILGDEHVIEGNYIGTDAGGSLDRGNYAGIVVRDSNATIGGSVAGAGNVISGNEAEGIFVSCCAGGPAPVVVRGNIIGLGADGSTSIGNAIDGVSLQGDNQSSVATRPATATSSAPTAVRVSGASSPPSCSSRATSSAPTRPRRSQGGTPAPAWN